MKKKVFTLLLSAALLCGGTGSASADVKYCTAAELMNSGRIQILLEDCLSKYFGSQNVQKPEMNQNPEQNPNQNQGQNAVQPNVTQSGQVVTLVNARRQEAGLATLQNDSSLAAIAQKKAEDMAKNGYFSHTSPTYGSAFDMLKAAGYSYRTAGENIAKGQKTADAVMKGWMNSSGHRANILGTGYTKIGVGYAVSSGGTPYWVQIFAG